MFSSRALFLLALGAVAVDAPPALRVIRTTPAAEAGPGVSISVTFDRPVAGSLDRTVDPRGLLTIEPAVAGTVEWRDPVTLRFRPDRPFASGVTYRVTVAPSFAALDGSRLAEAHRFSFRVGGPEVLTGTPVGGGGSPQHLRADETFTLVLSSAADRSVIERLAYLAPGAGCRSSGNVRLAVVREVPIPANAPWQIREAGGWDRDRAADSLRRIVELRPVTPFPLACSGFLVLPARFDAERPGAAVRHQFSTYGPLRVVASSCGGGGVCPTGPVQLVFSTPVRGAEVLRRVRILPETKFTVSDTAGVQASWTLWADLKPRRAYLIDVDPGLTDVFGQRLTGNPRGTATTTGYAPEVSYESGRLTIERIGPRTLPVTYVNVDTLVVVAAAVPESLEAKLLSQSWYGWSDEWAQLAPRATSRRIPVRAERDRHGVFGVPFPAPDAGRAGTATLYAVKVTSNRIPRRTLETGEVRADDDQPVALIQITDLGIHAKVGREEGVVWVTGASDGKPRPGARVTVRDGERRVLAQGTTDETGLFRFAGIRRPARPAAAADEEEYEDQSFEGYVEARLGADRALVGINQYDADLSPWQFNVASAWGSDRYPAAAAVFTERGIYRPGDSVFAKAIVRAGSLGSLRVPERTDSVRLEFQDRDGGTLAERVMMPSRFGTVVATLALPADAPLGDYQLTASLRRDGRWQELARAGYRVAEYRAPEFLVDVTADTAARKQGDTFRATIGARYLFGAPMARARVSWSLRQTAIDPWELRVPGADGYYLTNTGWWWEEWSDRRATSVTEARADSLDGAGQLVVTAPLELSDPGRAARVNLDAVVTDVNRQSVYGSASVVVHPTDFYIGAKPAAAAYFWKAGQAESVDVIAVRPDGGRVSGVAVSGRLVRREWHQVRRENDGLALMVGEWVQDTVDRCEVRTGAAASCRLTPEKPGSYTVVFLAKDGAGRAVSTTFYRWVTGPGWVPWLDESRFKMDVVPDRSRYAVGDTATVLFASPFTDAEAWITVEREGLIEQRRLRITDGATSLKLPVTEAWAPNAFVSIVVARGRSAAPGPLDDPGRPTIRVGYAEVRVTPERKRLAVALAPDRAEYRPGDEAAITATVRDGDRGVESEVALWAVDEGVLSLTGYRTPDPIDLLYQPRGLGLRLGSNLTTVAPQVAEGDKGRNPGGGGGDGSADVLRSRFRTTAFFLGTVLTDSTGTGTARVKLPDNLTTFRVMAVAVTAGDRYGSGQAPLLVTRPLLARAALPRFVRPGDRFSAGVVVNHRIGGTPTVEVKAQATGIRLDGSRSRKAVLEEGRGREVRFGFVAAMRRQRRVPLRRGRSGGDRDAVPRRADRPVGRERITTTLAGVVNGTDRLTMVSPDADPARSRVTLSLGSSPLTLLRGYANELRSILLLQRAGQQRGAAAGGSSACPAGRRRRSRRHRPAPPRPRPRDRDAGPPPARRRGHRSGARPTGRPPG
ncbi:MAG: MG2 domain-containing protein [Gemmatimonadales bacterium]